MKAQWKSIKPVPLPSRIRRGVPGKQGDEVLSSATGSFPNPAAIPAHFRLIAPDDAAAGTSELVRAYTAQQPRLRRRAPLARTLTNIVTPLGFLKARDEFLDRAFPILLKGIDQVYGSTFDVKGLTRYIREDGRRFLKEASIVYYELAAQHKKEESQALAFAELAKRFGLDLFDAAGKLVASEHFNERMLEFLRHRIVLGIRHRDGSRLTAAEIQSVIHLDEKSPFTKGWETYEKQVEKRLKSELVPCLHLMFGLYNQPFELFAPSARVRAGGPASRRACRDHRGHRRCRPHELEVQRERVVSRRLRDAGRSLEIDVELQKKTLGKVLIADRYRAESYVEIVAEAAHYAKHSARFGRPAAFRSCAGSSPRRATKPFASGGSAHCWPFRREPELQTFSIPDRGAAA